MIKSYKDDDTRTLFNGGHGHRSWRQIERVARRKLLMLDAATSLHDLKSPPNNKLEQLKRDRAGQHSIRVNDQWRICFRWAVDGVHDVAFVDYP